MVWGLKPENIHHHDSEAIQILNIVAADHPDHYPAFIAIAARNELYGKKLAHILRPMFLEGDYYSPVDFWELLLPEAIEQLIEDMSEDEEWREEWERL